MFRGLQTALLISALWLFPACDPEDVDSSVSPIGCCDEQQCASEAGAVGQCQRATCDLETCACVVVELADGSACEDGDECTSADTCQAGECAPGTPICDCSVDADCALAEDGDLCNGTLLCDTAAFPPRCVVNPATVVTCGGATGPCISETCNPQTGVCEALDSPEGTPCDDGVACTSGDTCLEGQCQAGESICECSNNDDCAGLEDGDACNGTLLCDLENFPHRCAVDPRTVVVCDTESDGPCQRTECEASTGSCERVDSAAGTPCEDGEACTSGDTCSEGACLAGRGVCDCQSDDDCAALEDGDACNGTLVCNTADFPHRCEVDPQTVVACDTQQDGPCAQSLCQPETGQCALTPRPEGISCDADENGCTVGDRCDGEGTCQSGGAADCSFLDDTCGQGLCASIDSLTFTCRAEARNEGEACDDGDPFTLADICTEGSCRGDLDRDLDGTPDAVDCEPLDPALPNCNAKACGDDGCGGSCGECPQQGSCFDFACQCRIKSVSLGEEFPEMSVYGFLPIGEEAILVGAMGVFEDGERSRYRSFVAKIDQSLDFVWLIFPDEGPEDSFYGIAAVHHTEEGVLVHIWQQQANHFLQISLDGEILTSTIEEENDHKFPYGIKAVPGRGYVMAGTKDDEAYISFYNEQLEVVWDYTHQDAPEDFFIFEVVEVAENDTLMAVGSYNDDPFRTIFGVLMNLDGEVLGTYTKGGGQDIRPMNIFADPGGGFTLMSLGAQQHAATPLFSPERDRILSTRLDSDLNEVIEHSADVSADFFFQVFGDRTGFRMDNGEMVARTGQGTYTRFSEDLQPARRFDGSNINYLFDWPGADAIFTTGFEEMGLMSLTGALGCACGDGVCDPDLAEDCASCPSDCGCGEALCLGQDLGCCLAGQEACDGSDGDCDGRIDRIEGDNQCAALDYFCDLDGDGLVGVQLTGVCDAFDCVPPNCTVEAGQDEDDHLGAHRSCLEILDANPEATDGLYSIDDDGSLQTVLCQMEGPDAGWTLIMKTLDNSDLGYDSTYWTTDALFNGDRTDLRPASAKLAAFNAVPFTTIRGCVESPSQRCIEHTFDEGFDSALELFSGPYVPIEGEAAEAFRLRLEEVFGPEGHEDCPPQLPGFNAFDENNNGNAARWGFFNNINGQECQPNPEQDSDGSIGWGLQIDGSAPRSAGTSFFGNNDEGFATWLWVR